MSVDILRRFSLALLFVLIASRPAHSQGSRFREPGSQRREVEGNPQRETNGDNDDSSHDAEEAEQDAQYDRIREEVSAAFGRHDYREALRLLYRSQELR